MRLYPIYIWKKDKNIDTFQALLPNFQTIVQRKYVGILAILHLQWELNPEPWGLHCITIPYGQKNFIRKYICYL